METSAPFWAPNYKGRSGAAGGQFQTVFPDNQGLTLIVIQVNLLLNSKSLFDQFLSQHIFLTKPKTHWLCKLHKVQMSGRKGENILEIAMLSKHRGNSCTATLFELVSCFPLHQLACIISPILLFWPANGLQLVPYGTNQSSQRHYSHFIREMRECGEIGLGVNKRGQF